MLGTGVVTRSSRAKKYRLNKEKAISKKIANICAADDIHFQKKDGGQCVIIAFRNSISYEKVKRIFKTKYAGVVEERRDDDGANVEDIYKLPGLSVHLYHTNNKIMVQGKSNVVSVWVDSEFCCILNNLITTDKAVDMPLPMSPPLSLSPPPSLSPPRVLELPISPPMIMSASNSVNQCAEDTINTNPLDCVTPINNYTFSSNLSQPTDLLSPKISFLQTTQLDNNLRSFILNEITCVKKAFKAEKLQFNSQLEQLRVENAVLRDEVKRLSNEVHSCKDIHVNLKKRLIDQENISASLKKLLTTKNPSCSTISTSTCEDNQQQLINDTKITSAGIMQEAPFPIPVKITQRDDRARIKPSEHSSPSTLQRPRTKSNSTQYSVPTVKAVHVPVVQRSTHYATNRDSTQHVAAPYTNQTTKHHLILGDSTLKGLHPDIMATDHYERVSVIALPGANFEKIRDVISSRSRDSNTTTVTLHCGVNDSLSNVRLSKANMLEIVRSITHKFPNATIRFSSIVPPCRGKGRQLIDINNRFLQSFCISYKYCFINNTPFFTAKSGAPRQRLYSDSIHLTKIGSSILAKNIKYPQRAVSLTDKDHVQLSNVKGTTSDLVSTVDLLPTISSDQLNSSPGLHHLMGFSPLLLHQALMLSLKRLPGT